MNVHPAVEAVPKPTPLRVNPENIPQSLKDLRQWVVWRYVQKDGKWTKPPYRVDGNGCRGLASSTDAGTWSDFPAALDSYRSGGLDGIGIALTPDMEIVGVDLDHSYNPETRAFEPWAAAIIDHFSSYTEVSPSGTGVRIFLKGALPAGGRKKGNVEIYSSGRYLTVTGRVLKKDNLRDIEPRQEQIDAFLLQHFPPEPKPETNSSNGAAHQLSDHDILDIAFRAKNGAKIRALYEGDWSAYQSQSEADMALCSLLVFYADSSSQLDRLYRGSKLYREKWDKKHHSNGQSYGEWTVDKALAGRTEHYEPRNGSGTYSSEQLTDKSNENGRESVNCYLPAGEDEPTAEKPVCFPEEAWQGAFSIWRNIVCPATESPQEYLWVSCLVTMGLALGRSVVLRNPRCLYPNFFGLLLGQTGDDRKSTALDFCQEALFRLGLTDSVHVLHGIQSSEAIFDSLGRCEGAKTLAHLDELRSLLGVTRRTGAGDIIPRLGSLYYCPAQESLDRHGEESTIITKPFLSLITATPLEYVQDLLGEREINGGFLNRFLTVTGKPQSWKAIASPPEDHEWEPFTRAVRDIAGPYSDYRFTWTDESKELWTNFYVAWKTDRQSWSAREQQLTARIDEHILKLALVYSAIQKQQKITCDALVTAISIGKWLQSVTLGAFSEVGYSAFSKAEGMVLRILKKHKRIYRRYLQQWVYKHGVDGDLLNRVISSLAKNGQAFEGKEKMASGHDRPWVEYVSPGLTVNT